VGRRLKRLRIAVWHNLPSGGGKRQLYYHVKGLVDRGHYVESWCPDTADQTFLGLGAIVPEHIVPLSGNTIAFHRTFRPLSLTRELLASMEEHCRKCASEISQGAFDILYANACMFLRTPPIAREVNIPTALYLGEPYRWFYEALPELPWIAPPSHLQEKRGLFGLRQNPFRQNLLDGVRLQARAEVEFARAFDTILVNSLYSREAVLRAYNLESKVCYLGVDTDYYHPTCDTKEDYIIGLGTIYHAKGVDRAIQAVGHIEAGRRPTLVWVGNGADRADCARYKALARQLCVEFDPRMDLSDVEVISLLSRARALIYTSRLEPFGLAPLEANACGTAVVGIAEGGVKESIVAGVNGFLSRDYDSKDLSNYLIRFLDDATFARQMGDTARSHVKTHWSLDNCTNNIERCLLALPGAST